MPFCESAGRSWVTPARSAIIGPHFAEIVDAMKLQPLVGPWAWHGDDLKRSSSWIHALSEADIGELDAALARVSASGGAPRPLEPDEFPLPNLGARLAHIGSDLENGCGVAKLTGLPVQNYDVSALQRLFFGLASHLGTPVYQNTQGELVHAICDEGPDVGARYGQVQTDDAGGTFLSSRARAMSNRLLRFHTDRCDVVGLLCVRKARSGGVSRVASSVAVYNEMLRRRPDLVDRLFAPYHRSRFGEEANENGATYALPVFAVREGKFTSHYSRTYIESAQLLDDVPSMTAADWEALDLLHAVAEELCMEMVLEPGDIQLLNSHVTYHARTAFEDPPDAIARRLLYRLWLSVPNSRALPDGHEVLWRNVDAGALRGGIVPATATAAAGN